MGAKRTRKATPKADAATVSSKVATPRPPEEPALQQTSTPLAGDVDDAGTASACA